MENLTDKQKLAVKIILGVVIVLAIILGVYFGSRNNGDSSILDEISEEVSETMEDDMSDEEDVDEETEESTPVASSTPATPSEAFANESLTFAGMNPLPVLPTFLKDFQVENIGDHTRIYNNVLIVEENVQTPEKVYRTFDASVQSAQGNLGEFAMPANAQSVTIAGLSGYKTWVGSENTGFDEYLLDVNQSSVLRVRLFAAPAPTAQTAQKLAEHPEFISDEDKLRVLEDIITASAQ